MSEGPDSAFAEAVLPDRWRAFGRTLQPLCAGHVLLMQRCGILDESRKSSLADHLLVTWICSRPFDPRRPWAAVRLGIRGRIWAWMLSLVFRLRPDLLPVRIALLTAYISRSLAAPEAWESGGEDRATGAPWLAHYVTALVAMGLTVDEALSMPIQRGNWLLSTRAEQLGRIQIINEHERQVMASTTADEAIAALS